MPGIQAGYILSRLLWVRLVELDPSAFMTKISRCPSRSDTKAIRRLSGDHAGLVSSPGSWVRLTRDEPLGDMA